MADRDDFAGQQIRALGSFIREQRQRAHLSLRQLADLADISNPYLSQVERGLHQPSVRVLKAIATALDVSAEVLLAEAGLLERGSAAARGATGQAAAPGGDDAPDGDGAPSVEAAIAADPRLTDDQKTALVQVYRSYVGASEA